MMNNIKKYYYIYVSFIVLLLVYFFYFNNIVSIDTEDALLNPKSYFLGWIGFNRYSLTLINYLLSFFSFNILFRRIVTFILFYISSVIFNKTFMKWTKNNNSLLKLLLILIIGSCPIFAEQFNFTLQGIPIAFGLLLMSISFLIFDKYHNNILYIILFIIVNVICFSLYQSFVLLYISIIAFYMILNVDSKNTFFKMIIREAIIFFIIIIIYYSIGYLLKNYIFLNNNPYIGSLIRWKELGLTSSILHVGYYGVKMLLSMDYFHVLSYLILFISGIVCILKNKNWIKLILYVALALIPFLLIIVSANNIPYRSEFSYSFVLVFMILFLINNSNLKKVLYIIMCLIIVRQSIFTFSLLYFDYVRFNNDIKLINYISEISEKNPNKGIVVVGSYKNNGALIKGETLGQSMASWDSNSDFGVNNRIASLMNAYNISFNQGSIEFYKKYKNTNSNYYYPNKLCYNVYDDGIVIYLR